MIYIKNDRVWNRQGIEAMEAASDDAALDRSEAGKSHLEWCLRELLGSPNAIREELTIGAAVGLIGAGAVVVAGPTAPLAATALITAITGGFGFSLAITLVK